MRPVPIPREMVPTTVPHRVTVVGPKDLLDEKAPAPIETLILEDGFHIRIALDDNDMKELIRNPHLHLIINANKLPPFWIGTEETALNNYGNPK